MKNFGVEKSNDTVALITLASVNWLELLIIIGFDCEVLNCNIQIKPTEHCTILVIIGLTVEER
jgi:hypothetical protein